jgi:hypothetical protein
VNVAVMQSLMNVAFVVAMVLLMAIATVMAM